MLAKRPNSNEWEEANIIIEDDVEFIELKSNKRRWYENFYKGKCEIKIPITIKNKNICQDTKNKPK